MTAIKWGAPLPLNARLLAAIPIGTPVQRLAPLGWFRRILRLSPYVLYREDEPFGTPWRARLNMVDVWAVRFPAGHAAYGIVDRAMQG